MCWCWSCVRVPHRLCGPLVRACAPCFVMFPKPNFDLNGGVSSINTRPNQIAGNLVATTLRRLHTRFCILKVVWPSQGAPRSQGYPVATCEENLLQLPDHQIE